jgi:hypothetical protein
MSRVKIKVRRSRNHTKPDRALVILAVVGVFVALVLFFWKQITQSSSLKAEITNTQTIDSLTTPLDLTGDVSVTPPPDIMPVIAPDAAKTKQARMKTTGDYLLVEKSRHLLHHYRDGKLLTSYKVALGKNPEDKAKVGDNATPEGHFQIDFINDSSTWSHDFGDGKGSIKGAYGPFFIGIKTSASGTFSGKAWTGIGIHGTHDPASIGTNASEGCIRMHNNELLKLKASIEGKEYVAVDIIK